MPSSARLRRSGLPPLKGSEAAARRGLCMSLSGAARQLPQRGEPRRATTGRPYVCLLYTSALVTMLRESGFFELLSAWLRPLFTRLGIPPELAPLMLIRPISGSAALAVGADLMWEHGVDSLIGRTAAVMLGSSETTFYTISVYFGAAGIKRTRYAIPAALCADVVGFFCAALFTRLFFS